ncbi:MAG: T9SS type A sorting domain-containing protein [Balneolaceae bacterium]
MKKSLLFILAILMMPILTQAQDGEWTYEGIFPADSSIYGAIYDIAVDAEGKIWMQGHYATGLLKSDSTTKVIDIHVLNPDGTKASFSPIQKVTVNGVEQVFTASNGRGMRATHDGNILFAYGTELYLIDHTTGEGIAHVSPNLGTSIAGPAVDAAGNIYVSGVVGGAVKQYSADLDTTQANGEVVIDAVPSVGRTLEVSRDGNTIFAPRRDLGSMLVYNRTALTPFGAADTVLRGSIIESIAIDGHNDDVWVSTGSTPDPSAGYTPYTWYAYNADDWSQTDSVQWVIEAGNDSLVNATQPPKAIAFSNDYNTLYVGVWRSSGDQTYPVQKFTRNTPVSNEDFGNSTPSRFKLEQNYPNPFNPTTNINFTIQKTGNVTLKVYDITGREVATLVNNTRYVSGSHMVTFDASNLASGVYLYSLQADGVRLTNKMTLIK